MSTSNDKPVESGEVRVRFCPSPTGTPHVGMVRTALFNWAYAKHTGGKFIFRVEDTDAARDSEESLDQILESLEWLGIDWDEGVGVGGPHGPYRQSERMDIYADVAKQLLDGGYAYESFSTPAEVEARHIAAGRSPKLGYDGFDRDLTEEQKQAFRDEGREPVIRMRMPDEDVSFDDMVRGTVTFKAGSVPDYVIVRANGDPLYTLVNPVDDALMEVTHVLRGEDILSSTPRQLVLMEALKELGIAKEVPTYGHLPYVMGQGNQKLSKRDPESNLLLHRKNGMLPEGLLNYLALLGWAISADEDIFTMEEMTKAFDIADVNPNPARFDIKKATAINATHIRKLDPQDFLRRLVEALHKEDMVSAAELDDLTPRERKIVEAAAPLVQTRLQLMSQAPPMLEFLFKEDDQIEVEEAALKQLRESAPEALAAAIEALEGLEEEQFVTEQIQAALSDALVQGLELRPRFAFTPPRVALTGRRVSPPLFESMEILGKEATLSRLKAFSETL